jgi:hypothetical protein
MPQSPHHSTSGADKASDVRDELKHDAEHIGDTIADRAKQEAEIHKNDTAHAVGAASSALGAAAGDLERNPDAPDWMASALNQAARKIEDMASQFEGRSVDDIAQRVTRFARENPGSFLAASAAAGFAAARVMRAGVDRSRHDHEGSGNYRATGDYQAGSDYDPNYLHSDRGTQRGATRNVAPGYMDVDDTIGGVAP